MNGTILPGLEQIARRLQIGRYLGFEANTRDPGDRHGSGDPGPCHSITWKKRAARATDQAQ